MTITITGQNSYLRSQDLAKLQQEFVQQSGELGLEKLDGEALEMGQLLDLLQAGNLFAAERFVVVRDLSVNKALSDKIEEILSAAGDGVTLVLHEPSLDMRTSYAKTLQKKTDFRKFTELPEPDLIAWLTRSAKDRGGELSWSEAAFLMQRVGGSQQLLSNELDKLLGFNVQVSRESIEQLTVPSIQSSIFELLDSAFRGDSGRAISLYQEQRVQQMEPQAILSMIAWQLHILVVVKLGGRQSPEEIARAAKLSPFVVRKSASVVAKLPLPRLKQLLMEVIDLEIRSKSEALDVDDAVQVLLLSIAA